MKDFYEEPYEFGVLKARCVTARRLNDADFKTASQHIRYSRLSGDSSLQTLRFRNIFELQQTICGETRPSFATCLNSWPGLVIPRRNGRRR